MLTEPCAVNRGQNNHPENNFFSELNVVITLYRTMCDGE